MVSPIEKLDLRLNCLNAATLIGLLTSIGGSTTIGEFAIVCLVSVTFIG